MSYTSDQAQYQFIGNVTYNSAATIDALPLGAMAIIDEANAVKTDALTSTAYYRIVQKKADGNLLFSPLFLGSDIVSKSQTSYVANKNQVTYIGTNAAGTSVTGMGTHTAGDIYQIGVGINDWGSTTTSQTFRDLATEAITGDTDKTITGKLFDSAQRVLKRNAPYEAVNVERIADVASIAAYTDNSTICKFTKGSKTVSVYVKDADATLGLTASQLDATAADVVAIASTNGRSFTFTADIAGTGAGRHGIYIGTTSVNVADAGTAAQNATAIAAAINASSTMSQIAYASASTTTVTITYKNDNYLAPPMVMQTDDDSTWVNVAVTIASGESKENIYHVDATVANSATFTLDKPWQGETCYLYEGTGTGVTASTGIATLTASKYGLKFSGLPRPFDAVTSNTLPISFSVQPYRSSTGIEDTVNVVTYQGATEGSGNYSQVASKEVLTQFQNKGTFLQTYPPTKYKLEADAGTIYTLTELRIKNELNTTMIGSNPKTFITIELAVAEGITDNTTIATVFSIS